MPLWYHANISRESVEKKLKKKSDGTFIIRDSGSSQVCVCVCVPRSQSSLLEVLSLVKGSGSHSSYPIEWLWGVVMGARRMCEYV